MRRWWSTRSARTRIVVSAAVPLALALIIGTVAVAAVFAHGRIEQLDRQTLTESDVLRALLVSEQLPTTLPLPVSSSLLAQVLDAQGDVLASTPSASRIQPLVGRARSGIGTDEHGSYSGAPLRVRRTVVTVNGQGLLVVVAAPLTDVRSALRALRAVVLLVIPLLLVLTTGVIWWATGLALRPMGALLEKQRTFVADAAHELRAPITSLVVQLDVAAAQPDPEAVPALLKDLGADVERLSRLADDLLLLARVGDVPLVEGVVDLRALLGQEGSPVLVRGSETALRRLLDNLLSNAGRYASNVAVQLVEAHGRVTVHVDDDGPGIPVGDRERVFDRWVRLDQGRARSEGGSGLGLALARAVAVAHGGTLTAEESPQGGARLTLVLPGVQEKIA